MGLVCQSGAAFVSDYCDHAGRMIHRYNSRVETVVQSEELQSRRGSRRIAKLHRIEQEGMGSRMKLKISAPL